MGQPSYSPPNMSTPVWHRVMAEFPDLKDMVELVMSEAQSALAGEELDREALVESKWAMETASADVTKFNERLDTAEINNSNRDDFREVRKELTRYRVQIGKFIYNLNGKINDNPNTPAASAGEITNAFRTTARAPVISLPTYDGS